MCKTFISVEEKNTFSIACMVTADTGKMTWAKKISKMKPKKTETIVIEPLTILT